MKAYEIRKIIDFFALLCYCDTKNSKVQSFNIDKYSSDKLLEHWLPTVQSQSQDFKFPLSSRYTSKNTTGIS